MYQVLKALHVISMFVAFAFFMAPLLLSALALRRRDAAALRSAVDAERLFGKLGGAAVATGVGLGIATALTGKLRLLSTWLVIAYALLLVIIVVGNAVIVPRLHRIAEASGTSGTLEADALARGRGVGRLLLIPPTLFLLIAADMVIKPFS